MRAPHNFGHIEQLPSVHLGPDHPALQAHNPSVRRHILQLGEQILEQFLPVKPSLQANQSKEQLLAF